VFPVATFARKTIVHRNLQRVSVLAFLAVALSIPIPGFGQNPEHMSVEDAVKSRSFGYQSPLAFSSDGTKVAYMVQENGKLPRLNNETEDEFYVRTGVFLQDQGSDILVSYPSSGETRNITGGQGANWQPAWSPEGRYLAFLSDRDGSGQAKLWIWDSTVDQLRLVSNTSIRATPVINELKWTADSKHILATTIPQGMSLNEYVQKVCSPGGGALPALSEGVAGSTATVYVGASPGAAENAELFYRHDLVSFDIASGRTDTIVHGQRIGWYTVSPNGDAVAYAVLKDVGTFRHHTDLVVTNLLTMHTRVLVSNALLAFFSWSPNGSWIAYSADGVDETSYDYYLVATDGGSPRKMSHLPHQPCCNHWQLPMWDEENRSYFFLHDGALWQASIESGKSKEVARIPNRQITFGISVFDNRLWTSDDRRSTVVIAHDDEQKCDSFYKINLNSGQSTKLLEMGQSYTGKWNTYLTGVSGDMHWLAYISEDAAHPPDLWITDAAFRNRRQISHLNPQLEKYTMGAPRLIEWLNDEGQLLHGALLLPSGYREGERYPLLVWVYPSVLSDDFDRFGLGRFPGPFNMQLFATRGYAVLLPDASPTVSARLDSLATSVLSGVNKVIELGIADPKRLGVFGQSQGGYLALAMVTKSHRFRGAVAASGWGDYTAYYGVLHRDGSGYEQGQAERQLGGNPWDHPLRYLENSPMYSLDEVGTPLLLLQGGMDEDHPAFLFDQVFVGLRRLGRTVEYVKYEGEGHAPRDWHYANQLDLATRVLGWFDRYVGKDSSSTASN
jgi:dipeptidyl aminopeptidase/acylaminoacyl peptidase